MDETSSAIVISTNDSLKHDSASVAELVSYEKNQITKNIDRSYIKSRRLHKVVDITWRANRLTTEPKSKRKNHETKTEFE